MSRDAAPGLGAALFLSEPLEDNLARLDAFPARGLTAAFTSLHIPEERNTGEQEERARALGAAASAVGVRLYADVSPLTLRRLALPGSTPAARLTALAEWGLAGVRFDFGFGIETIAQVSREMPIQLNASTVSAAETRAFVAAGGSVENVEVLHNYYPRVDTGLARAPFLAANRRFRDAGLRVGAFVPGDEVLRGPLHVGLPTLEEHRDVDPLLAAVDLWRGTGAADGVDTVYVGDIDLRPATWARWAHLRDGVVSIRWLREAAAATPAGRVADWLGGRVLSNRVDEAARVIRVEETRALTARPDALRLTVPADAPGGGAPRHRGAVTVDNEDYGRYSGEVQVTREDRPADPRVTVLGRVVEADRPLLDLLPGGARFLLIES